MVSKDPDAEGDEEEEDDDDDDDDDGDLSKYKLESDDVRRADNKVIQAWKPLTVRQPLTSPIYHVSG